MQLIAGWCNCCRTRPPCRYGDTNSDWHSWWHGGFRCEFVDCQWKHCWWWCRSEHSWHCPSWWHCLKPGVRNGDGKDLSSFRGNHSRGRRGDERWCQLSKTSATFTPSSSVCMHCCLLSATESNGWSPVCCSLSVKSVQWWMWQSVVKDF